MRRRLVLAATFVLVCCAPVLADTPRLLVQSRHAGAVTAIASSDDGALVATGGQDGTVRLWDAATQQLDSTSTAPQAAPVSDLAFQGHVLAVQCGASLARWNVSNPFQPQPLSAAAATDMLSSPPGVRYQQQQATCQRWEADHQHYLAGFVDGSARTFDSHGQAVQTFVGNASPLLTMAFSPDGQSLQVGTAADTVVWSLTGSQLGVRVQPPDIRRAESYNKTPQFSARPPVAAQNAPAKANAAGTESLAAQPRVAMDGGRISLRSAQGRESVTLPQGLTACDVALSSDGSVAIALAGGQVLGWRPNQPLTTLIQHAYEGRGHLAFSPDGNLLATGGDDAVVRFWPASGGAEPLAQAVHFDNSDDWVAVDAAGHFDGSSAGQHRMQWLVGGDVYRLEQFFNGDYRPGLLATALSTPVRQTRLGAFSGQITTLPSHPFQPPPRIVIESPATSSVATPDIIVDGDIEDRGGGISQPRLFLNGHCLAESARLSWRGSQVRFRVRLLPGENHLRLTAFNRDGSIESRGAELAMTCTASTRAPILYVLAVGIDCYRSGLSLSCACNDARSVAGFFKPGLFATVRTTLLTNEHASRAGIMSALHRLDAETDPQDAVVVYLAGHGTLIGDTFYYLPYDVNPDSLATLRASALSSGDLGEALVDMPATQQVLVLDACHSGAAAGILGPLLARRDLPAETLAVQRLAHVSGSFLIAAAKKSQTAKEIPALRHGLLTYAMLHGLGEDGRPAAPENDAGQVTMTALLHYLDAAVPALTWKYQGADTQDVVQASTGQDFPIVGPETRDIIRESD